MGRSDVSNPRKEESVCDPSKPQSTVVRKNVAAIIEQRKKMENRKSRQERIADSISGFAGSIPFLYLHAIWFGGWIVVNGGYTPLPAFDPFPYGLLTTTVSLEAIFLSGFLLLSQNRANELAEQRANLDLQINLLAEQEATKLLCMVDQICKSLNVRYEPDDTIEELERETDPREILRAVDGGDEMVADEKE